MPVTFAHPLAVIPLKRIFVKLSYPALICGSCGPDIELFVPFLNIPREWSHTAWGLFATSIPLAILLYLLFEQLFREIAEESLPWQISIPRQNSSAGVVLFSILLGAFTHVFWDSFTHENTFITGTFSLFNITLFSVAGHGVIVSKVLQYFSSIVGTALVMLYTLNSYRAAIRPGTEPEWYRLNPLFTAVIFTPFLTLLLLGLPASLEPAVLYSYLKPVLTTTTLLFLAILAVSHRYQRLRLSLFPLTAN